METQPSDREFFREMTLRICASLDIDQALQESFLYLRQHMPVDAMGLGFSDLPSRRIQVLSKIAKPEAEYLWQDGASSIKLSDAMLHYIQSDAVERPPVLMINRPGQPPPPLLEAFPGIQRNSALFVRLDIRSEEIGALLISAKGWDRYSQNDADLLDTIREPFAIAMSNARRYQELKAIKDRLADDHQALTADMKRVVGFEVVGAEFGLREVMELVRKVAPSASPALLLGETGTGKEVIANAIHQASARSSGPMITMQCGAIPESLLDSELFGHERGAFTGASERKRGRFERADGGTLFLDEIGELSPEAQVKLLRVLQEKRFERVGGTETLKVDVRVIAATHRDLGRMVRQGEFREDLWYRLNVLPVTIPPLRQRSEDIPSLVHYFVHRKALEMNLEQIPSVFHQDLERLQRYRWPGNVRELQNIVERALILSKGNQLVFPDLSEPAAPGYSEARQSASVQTLDHVVTAHIRSVIDSVDGRVSGKGGAAELLGMNPSTLRFRMRKLGLSSARGRGRPIGS